MVRNVTSLILDLLYLSYTLYLVDIYSGPSGDGSPCMSSSNNLPPLPSLEAWSPKLWDLILRLFS